MYGVPEWNVNWNGQYRNPLDRNIMQEFGYLPSRFEENDQTTFQPVHY